MKTEASVCWPRVSALIADRLGLHFPDGRLRDLQRAIAGAAGELGLAGPHECARRLLDGRLDPAQLETLTSHLTIGETYFFRGEETFAALARHVLPPLIERRRGEKRLRVWSAACCTGEEAYSLAIVLRQVLPDIDDWQVEIHATDIDARFLRKAVAGVYGQWSFRGMPADMRRRWFRRRADGCHEVVPEVRRMVRFAPMNLVEGDGPPTAAGGPLDLILCRNVLMYFTAAQAARVVARLRRSLHGDGWLVVAPCEVSRSLLEGFVPVLLDGAILHRQTRATTVQAPMPGSDAAEGRAAAAAARTVAERAVDEPAAPPPPAIAVPPTVERRREPRTGPARRLQPLPRPARFAHPAGRRLAASQAAASRTTGSATEALPARNAGRLADQGRLDEALARCDEVLAGDRMDAHAHYLRAMVLMERGDLRDAKAAMQRSLYLQPDEPVACCAAGNLERALGNHGAADGHYRHALGLLERGPAHGEPVNANGVDAGQLTALVRSLMLARTG